MVLGSINDNVVFKPTSSVTCDAYWLFPAYTSLRYLFSLFIFKYGVIVPNASICFRLGGNAKLCNILAHSNLYSKCAPVSSTVFHHQLPQAFSTGNGTLCTSCKSPNVLVPWANSNNNCECADPITIDLRLKSPSFYTFTNPNNLASLVASQLNLSRIQVFLQAYEWQPGPRLRTKILIFPLNSSRFSPYMYNDIFSFFVNWGFTTGLYYGPYEILYFGSGTNYNYHLVDICNLFPATL